MLDETSKKLIFFLISKKNNNNDNKKLLEFIQLVKNGKIPSKLIKYLYSYLYTNDAYSDVTISLKYEKDIIKLEESMIRNNSFILKESSISQSEICDIKRKTWSISSIDDKHMKCKKSIRYSLDSNIDIIIAESIEAILQSSKELKEFFLDKEEDYVKVSMIDDDPKKYITIDKSKGYVEEYETYMNRGELIEPNKEDFKKENLTSYSNNSYKRLYELNKNMDYIKDYDYFKKDINEKKYLNHYDEEIFNDIDEKIIKDINKDYDFAKMLNLVKGQNSKKQ